MSELSKTCPFCGSHRTEKQSDFGTSVMTVQYYCQQCRSVFEWIKWGDTEMRLDLPDFLQDPSSTN